MTQYRKKSLVEAVQFDGSHKHAEELEIDFNDRDLPDGFSMITKQGRVVVNSLDYIINNPDGERYPCNWQTFEDTYELVD